MAIDTASERISATNFLTGLRVLFPTGSIDQANRQASARTVITILAIPPIVYLDGPIYIKPAIDASSAILYAIDSALSVRPALKATSGIN